MEEKLTFPREEIVDTKRSSAIKTPKKLSRPKHLGLYEKGVRASHPSQAKLVDEKERGRLLHFFGNHELLATELMALAILKFPDAPASFRRGLLETLKDEQVHTQLYLHRMKQCGVEFGELPLSDYFWRSVSSMEDPLDYVTRLSLTFEQANLDYSREYGKVFSQVGDRPTARILDQIYRDEIDHVGFGLKWFRRWKAEGKTDWEAFRERLVFPLSPARAKGNFYNKQGRSDAGLDDSFINDLEVFSQSRGRTPFVYWFNPDAERFAAMDCAEDVSCSQLQRDLSFLPAFLAGKDDILVTPELPDADFRRSVQAAGFELPEVFRASLVGSPTAPEFDRKIGDLRPWAWSPDSVAFFEANLGELTKAVEAKELWNPSLRKLYSKSWSLDIAKHLAKADKSADWFAPSESLGTTVNSIDALQRAREVFAEKGYRNIVCKASFGTAANANRCVMEKDTLDGRLRDWAENVLQEQGELIVEPWLDRVFDFSVQMEFRDGVLRCLGYTRLLNNARGQFRGIVTDGFCSGLPSEHVKFIMRRTDGRPRVYHWYEQTLAPLLQQKLSEAGFQGPLGVDAFIFRDAQGQLRLKPVVEINPRYTMGRVALELGRNNAATSVGLFEIVSRSQAKKCGFSNLADYASNLAEKNPVRLSEEKKPRLKSGSFPVSDPTSGKQFLALYHVRENYGELPLA